MIAAVVVDTSIVPALVSYALYVRLTVIFTLLIGADMGWVAGLAYGFIGGMLIDITCGTLGHMTLLCMAIGFANGLILYANEDRATRANTMRDVRRRTLGCFVCTAVLVFAGEITFAVIRYAYTENIVPLSLLYAALRAVIAGVVVTVLRKPMAKFLYLPGVSRSPKSGKEAKTF